MIVAKHVFALFLSLLIPIIIELSSIRTAGARSLHKTQKKKEKRYHRHTYQHPMLKNIVLYRTLEK